MSNEQRETEGRIRKQGRGGLCRPWTARRQAAAVSAERRGPAFREAYPRRLELHQQTREFREVLREGRGRDQAPDHLGVETSELYGTSAEMEMSMNPEELKKAFAEATSSLGAQLTKSIEGELQKALSPVTDQIKKVEESVRGVEKTQDALAKRIEVVEK